MNTAFFKLHLSIFIAGFTGVFGKLIQADAFVLVFHRAWITLAMLYLLHRLMQLVKPCPILDRACYTATGMLMGIHFLCFYGSIKLSNVSIGVICLSMVGFFTAILEPLILKRRFAKRELAYSLLSILGILLIFSLDTRHQLGIAVGTLAALTASLFTVSSKKVSAGHDLFTVLFYQFAGVTAVMVLSSPFYLFLFPAGNFILSLSDTVYMLLLCSVCTVGLYFLYIQVVQVISAFTVNLSYNLEPVYSIIIAMIIFHEHRELNASFIAGVVLIIMSVALQTISVMRIKD